AERAVDPRDERRACGRAGRCRQRRQNAPPRATVRLRRVDESVARRRVDEGPDMVALQPRDGLGDRYLLGVVLGLDAADLEQVLVAAKRPLAGAHVAEAPELQ